MSESVLELFAAHGLPALVLVMLGAALALPLPASLLLLTAGALVEAGEGSLLPLLLVALVATVCGDHAAYFLGRYASPFVERRVGPRKLRPARVVMHRYGGAGVFLSRWVVPPLGPAVSYTAGITRLPLPRFFIADVFGASLWVAAYVALGYYFSLQLRAGIVRVQGTAWLVLAGAVVISFLVRRVRRAAGAHRAPRGAPQWEAVPAATSPLPVTGPSPPSTTGVPYP